MSDNTVHSVRTLGRPPKVWLGVRTLCISLLLTTAPIAIAKADCPASPGGANDLLISFLAANNTQSAPALLHASTVKEGMLVYDDTDNALKLCDGDNWVEVGDGGLAAHGVAGAVQFSDGAGGLLSDNANLHWDDVNKRLGVGTIQPDGRLTIRSTGNGTDPFRVDGSSGNYLFRIYDNSGSGLASVWASGGAERVRLAGNAHSFFNAPGLNLGIGTTSPASKLHVVGGIQLADDAATCPGTSDVKLGTLKYAANVLSLCNTSGWTAIDAGGIGGVTPAGNDGSIQFKSGSNLAADAANLHWDNSTKRLGIGTTAPGAKFHVYGTGTSDARIRISGSGSSTNYSDLVDTGTGQLSVNSNMASGHALVDINAVPGDGTSQALVRLFRNTNTTGVRSFQILRGDNTTTSDHIFYAGNSGTVAAIGINGGNVGIGTSAPLSSGVVTIQKNNAGGDGGQLALTNGLGAVMVMGVSGSDANDYSFIKTNANEDLYFQVSQAANSTSPPMVIKASGNVGIGTTTPGSKLHVAGGIQLTDDAAACPGALNVKVGTLKYVSDVLSVCNTAGWTAIDAGGIGGVTPAGNDGSIQFKSGSNLAADAANLHWDDASNRLGIGTATPTAPLSFANTVGLKINLYDNAAGIMGFGLAGSELQIGGYSASAGQRTAFGHWSGGSKTFVEQMRLDHQAGNVGIGTATPGAKLHVYGAGNNGGAALFEAGSWNSVTIKGVNGAGVQDSAFLKFEDASGENTFIGLAGTAGANGGNVGDLRIGVSGERVRINKTTGYVGIGNVPLPRARLHVNGGVKLGDDADVCPGASNIKVGTLKYVSDVLSVCNTTGWTAIDTGGIGGATPAGNDGSIQFKSGSNLAADASNLHWDDTNNRLGIGTATPSSALHVPGGAKCGTLTATSSYAAHTVILSDGGTAFEGGLLLTNSDTSASGHSSVKLSSAFSAAAGNADFHLGVVNNDNPNTYVRTWLYGAGPTGNIGIGTTTPQSLLQVAGGIQLGDDTAACPGASNVKVGTLRYNGGALQICGTGGWAGVSGSGGTLTDGDKTDITVSGTGTVWTIDNNAVTTAKIANSNVTNAKLANMAANTIKGNNTGSAAAPLDLTVAQLATMLDGTGTFVLKAGDTMTGRLVNTGALTASQGMATATSNLGAFEARSQGSAGTAGAAFITFHRPSNQAVYFGLDTDNQLKVGGWSMGANAYKLWHENNDGSGSTLDADLLDGMNALSTATANTVVARDTNGDTTVRYLMSTYLNMSHAQATRNADTIFYSSTDNYLRKNNASGFRTSLDVYSKGEVDALAGSVTDGDKGDITVSGTGAIWTIDAGAVNSAKILDGTIATADLANSAVTNAKLANMAANTVKGNNTGSAAAPIDLTMAQLRAIIGTGTPGSGNFLRGDGTWQAVPAGTVTGTGTTNYVAKFTGASAVGDSQIFDNGTNVGIGTTAPASDLEIEKTAAGGGVHTEINNLSTANHSFSQLVLRNGTGNSNAGIQNNQGTGLPYTVFFTGAGVTGGMYLDVLANAPLIFRTNAGVERMRVTAAGNVGIGTPSPGARLDVSGDGATYGLRIINTGSGDGIRLQTEDATSNNGFYWSQGATVMINMFSSVNNTIARFASGGTTAIELNTSGSSYFNGGNVGIGTDAPSHILHITGQGRSTNSAWATSSDVRVKEDIHTITGGLDTLDKMRPVTFRYTDEYQNGNAALAGLRRGFIAQEVESVVPDMVTRAVEKVGSREISDFRVLGNSDFVPLLVSAVKELKAANDNLKADNDDLRDELRETINSQDDQIEILRREIEALKAGR